MPIANCIVSPNLTHGTVDPVSLWAEQAAVSIDLLTINFTRSELQLGVRYDVMATIQLPTAWSKSQAESIQLALAAALSTYFSVPAQQVHVVTQWVESGLAVENAEVMTW